MSKRPSRSGYLEEAFSRVSKRLSILPSEGGRFSCLEGPSRGCQRAQASCHLKEVVLENQQNYSKAANSKKKAVWGQGRWRPRPLEAKAVWGQGRLRQRPSWRLSRKAIPDREVRRKRPFEAKAGFEAKVIWGKGRLRQRPSRRLSRKAIPDKTAHEDYLKADFIS